MAQYQAPTAAIFACSILRRLVDDYNHLIQHVAGQRIPTVIYTPNTLTPEFAAALKGRVTVELFGFRRGPAQPLAIARTLMQGWQIGRRNPEAIFALMTAQPNLLWGLPLRLLNRRCVFIMAGMGTLFSSREARHRRLRPAVKALYRYLYSGRNCRVVVQNRDDYRYVIDTLVAREHEVYLMNGCGTDATVFPFFPKLPRNPRPVILVPARLIVEKGIFEAVAASGLLRERGIDHEMWFTFGIDPGNPIPLKQHDLEEFQRTNDSLRFLGFQPSVVPLFEACDIVCLPTYREGLPTALIEASACGRPIVTTDAIGSRDIVAHEQTGLLVPVRSIEPLADALQRMIQEPGLAERLRQNAYHQFQEKFTKEVTLQQVLPAFHSLGLPAEEQSG